MESAVRNRGSIHSISSSLMWMHFNNRSILQLNYPHASFLEFSELKKKIPEFVEKFNFG